MELFLIYIAFVTCISDTPAAVEFADGATSQQLQGSLAVLCRHFQAWGASSPTRFSLKASLPLTLSLFQAGQLRPPPSPAALKRNGSSPLAVQEAPPPAPVVVWVWQVAEVAAISLVCVCVHQCQ